ncbi:ATP-dependent (S)-NAD(P)H-hydrate dehydratase [Posidoniimonas polymericola]|uniref:ADP-dependent (S)-NAD(P)H-hydrate dehydratase n=1 Tax=Posidoniimonas polymericola TaxID=2528002 RepID=A0A5C5ZES5_9BACT|nr:NAD(P)H-hydrate dehydratase [Posidoniimonas polymericola]TWT85658.1 ATP-dependent (S)-NAD(P)H-hydrate dehydratase [Posidoniimonas polymericola]
MRDLSQEPLPALPPRRPESHKGDFGRAMIIGGSRGMAGAVAMAGMACLRSGAGLATLGVPRCIGPVVAGFCPAYMVRELVDDEPGTLYWANLFDLVPVEHNYTVWALGPGLGEPDATAELSGRMNREWTAPLVIDADGLNGVALYEARYASAPLTPPGPRVYTPHPGEFARLAGDDALAEQATGDDDARVAAAAALAARDEGGNTVVVLKGHRTVVTDGARFSINATGNPGMATGGSGDVLTGVITALIAQGLSAFDAARLGVHLHGLAGDIARERTGAVSLIATDLIDALPTAFQNPNPDS